MKKIIITLIVLGSSNALAWGQFGHEEVNNAAINLLDPHSSLGKCMNDMRGTVIRYAITPDVEWKVDMQLKNLSKADSTKRHEDDSSEHPLHFFEADSFIKDPKPGDLSKLPSGDYPKSFPEYRTLLSANAAYVAEVDKSKTISDPKNPSVKDITEHGTAPWRALQLYRLGVKALQAKDMKLALLYLGTMGHYIGDMSQPFHATLNFDGEYYPPNSPLNIKHDGIHHEIDTGLLPDGPKDPNLYIYEYFLNPDRPISDENLKTFIDAATNQSKTQYAEIGKNPFTELTIVPNIMKIVDGGYSLVNQLIGIYGDICKKVDDGLITRKNNKKRNVASEKKSTPLNRTTGHGGHGAIPVDDHEGHASGQSHCEAIKVAGESRPKLKAMTKNGERTFETTKIGDKEVLQILAERVGQSAGLLARIWELAYKAAGQPELGQCVPQELEFNQSFAIQKYPTPDYLP